MKRTIVLVFSLLLSITLLSAGDFIIGTGDGNTNQLPVYGYANYGWSKFFYNNAEMTAAGFTTAQSIEKIAFYVDTETTDYVMDNQQVYMGYFYDSAANTSYQNPVNHTLVYSGSVSWNGPGWMEIILDTPYTWDPTPGWNLEILWENHDGSRISGPPKFLTSDTAHYSSAYKTNSGSFPTSSGSRKKYHPDIWFSTPPTEPPTPAVALAPVHEAIDVQIDTQLRWQHTGGSPYQYLLWFGTDNPPSNIANGLVLTNTSYNPAEYLQYNTTYYWKVIPQNNIAPAMNCPVWSFTTMADPAIATFPHLESFDGDFLPAGWESYSGTLADPSNMGVSGSTGWAQKNWLNIAGDDKAASINNWGPISGYLISPLFNIPSEDYVLKIDAALLKTNQTPDGTPPLQTNTDDQFAILIGDGFTWSIANIVREYNNSGSEYLLHDIPVDGETITIPLTGHTGHVRFAFFSGSLELNDDNDFMLNNFFVGVPSAEADIPEGVNTLIGDAGDSVIITGGDANLNPEGVIPEWPNGNMVISGNYYLELLGTGPWTVVFTTAAPWGAYYSGGVWNPVENLAGTITFNIPVRGSKDLGVPIVLGDADPTLPVELSSFNAVLTAQSFVKLSWVSESETNLLGYRVYRNDTDELESAILMTPVMIQATNTSSTQSYSLEDYEVSMNNTYYYWLEAADYAHSSFFGPQFVEVTGEGIPQLPTQTTMRSAYPNPFKANTNTNIEVSVKEGDNGTVTIYNIVGQAVKSFPVKEGMNNLQWNGRDSKGSFCGSGVYFYKLSTTSQNMTRKMIIMR